MARFIKQGINKAKGQYIYPEPTQTNTGNCGAYASATCLYAFGLDHEPALIPTGGPDPALAFHYSLARMVEELTSYIYTEDLGMEAGVRKYLAERKLDDDFEVNSYPGTGTQTVDGREVSNFEFLLGELKRCQNVLAYVAWEYEKDGKTETARHAITMTGMDVDAKEVIAANPWGSNFGDPAVPPATAGANTAAGTGTQSHNFYDYSESNGVVTLKFHGHDAKIYEFLKVCPKEGDGTGSAVGTAKGKKHPKAPESRPPSQRFEYRVTNHAMREVNGFAVSLPGVRPEELRAMGGPAGWTCGLWMREREGGFAHPGPEREGTTRGFAGVVWRSQGRGLAPGESADGFMLDVVDPGIEGADRISGSLSRAEGVLGRLVLRLIDLADGARTWIPGSAAAWLLDETEAGTQACCVTVTVPERYCEVPSSLDALADSLENWRRGGSTLRGDPRKDEPGPDRGGAPEEDGARRETPDTGRERPPPRDIKEVEGIDEGFAKRLAEAGVRSLEDLAALESDAPSVKGVGPDRLKRWATMARLLRDFASLSGNDAELIVNGLHLDGPGAVSEQELARAVASINLPADYDLSRVRAFLAG